MRITPLQPTSGAGATAGSKQLSAPLTAKRQDVRRHLIGEPSTE
jgi:hypothetical protein